MKFVKTGFCFAAVALVFAACKNVDFKKTKGGVPYKIIAGKNAKDTARVREGSVIKFHMLVKADDSVITNTFDKMPFYQPMSAPQATTYDIGNAITEIMMTVKKGDSLYFAFNADSLIARDSTIARGLNIRKGQTLSYSFKILDVFKDQTFIEPDYNKEREVFLPKQMQKDDKIIQEYIAKQNITAKKNKEGTYVQILNPGTDPIIDSGKFVTLFYTGTTLKGKQFESNVGAQPAVFKMDPGMIKGFVDGLTGLGKGAKAKIFIPSMLAYGERPRSEIIGAFENLIFDVDIVDVTATDPTPKTTPPMPMPSMPDLPKQK